MLCLKKKKFWGSSSSYGPQSQSKNYGLDQGNGGSSDEANRRGGNRDTSRAKDNMAPPPVSQTVHPVVREVTEDTPPDLLEGTMDLLVILPSGKNVQTTVDRKTPMMDLLIHVATANKINPAGHIVQVRNERGIEMPYKPSTPIGALDTTTIEIVPKNRVNEYIIVKKPAKVANQPFETTFRLQVHLPRNQLYVMRISPKTLLEEILREVCQEKNLDLSKYEIRHPVNLDQKLPLTVSVGETGLQELTVVSKNSKINSSVSTADIIALQQSDECRGKGCLDGSFKHSRSSVGDSSVSSESTGSGRGISPCRSEDSRSISPLPLIRPKTLFHRTSNISTCSSSGNSSGLKTNTLESSVMSQVSHQQIVMQAPPRTKKRAAPQPPTSTSTTPVAKVNSLNSSTVSSIPSPISEKNEISSTPVTSTSNNSISSNGLRGGPPERPVPRKKEAPKEPPKPHPPLSHHQSLPLNHSRHDSGSIDPHQDVASFIQKDQNDSRQLDRTNHPVIGKMSRGHSISSSMTNLTSVSSVSSTSLASSTGGATKKRRAPKPPTLTTLLKHPTQIEEETTATDSEAGGVGGSLHATHNTDGNVCGESELNNKQQKQPTTEDQILEEEPTPLDDDEHQDHQLNQNGNAEISLEREQGVPDPSSMDVDVLNSRSPVSSLSSVSNSTTESTTSSPIPPPTSSGKASAQFISKSNTVSSSTKMKGKDSSLNINEFMSPIEGGERRKLMLGAGVRDYNDENESIKDDGTRNSRSSPSSSSNNNNAIQSTATTSPSPDSRSGNLSSSIAVDEAHSVVEENATPSCSRPPSSSNTQVSSTTPSRAMPLPLPRRRAAPSAPTQNATSKANVTARGSSTDGADEMPPKPKPRPRSDRKSMEPEISNKSTTETRFLKLQPERTSSATEPDFNPSPSRNVEHSIDTNTNTYASIQASSLRNPLSKYGVKVLPDNVLKERAERLKRKSESSSEDILSSSPPRASNALDSSSSAAALPPKPTKVPIQAKKSTSSCDSAIDDYSDSGSITSLSKTHNSRKGSGSGNTGFTSSRPAPSLSKSDYTSQGSVRSLKQLTSNNTGGKNSTAKAVVKGVDNELKDDYDSDNLEENLDFFEPASRNTGQARSLTKSVSPPQRNVSSSVPTSTATLKKEEMQKEIIQTRPVASGRTRVYSSVSAYEEAGTNLSRSPGVASDSGFTRTSPQKDGKMIRTKYPDVNDDDEEGKNVKLNRWQNMVSLNEIENAKEASTNKLMTRQVGPKQSNTNSGDLLQGDYQHTKAEAGDEGQNDATCHSSESEASYTDSGVPATETVTPSPVNLDDVILDHEFHATAQPEKLSSEDECYELKRSSRRSSLQSDHSEEWMNILESKMHKDEEAIEKMFEAVLPPTGDEIDDFSVGGDKVIDRKTEQVADESAKNEEITTGRDKKLKITGAEDEDEQDGREHEMIETTVELHHIPSTAQGRVNETREMTGEEESLVESAASMPYRKLPKSESFSHNSEFNEAQQRRKNFHSNRNNAIIQSSGSVTDLRHSHSSSNSDEELEDIGPLENEKEKFNNNNANSMQQHPNRIRDDRTMSMNDLTSARAYNQMMMEKSNLMKDAKMNSNNDDSVEDEGSSIHKAASLQQLPVELNREEMAAMEMFRKKLEMEFEQWKEEFMKKVVVSPGEEMEKTSAILEDDESLAEDKEEKVRDRPVELEQQINDSGIQEDALDSTKVDGDLKIKHVRNAIVEETKEQEIKNITSDSREVVKDNLREAEEAEVQVPSQEQEDDKMKDTEEYPPVELRKKRVESESPSVVYQYSGPPTIKMASWNERPRRAVSVKKDEDYIMGMGQQDANAKTPNPTRIHSFHGGPVVISSATTATDNGVSALKSKHESSPNPPISTARGWSAAINAPSLLQNSNGSVRSVLSTWKQKMEETEKEKTKLRDGPPAEIDIYGDGKTQSDVPPKNSRIITKNNESQEIIEKTVTPKAVVKPEAKPVPVADTTIKVSPNAPEKSKTLGSSFRTEKPIVFTISPMESNTLPRNKPKPVIKSNDVVDSKPKPVSSSVEVNSNAGSLEERKKFFQGVKPVENNGKEAPIPATNMKSNIAAIQKVFEKQRMTKMQQMGSQQSLYSDGTISPVPSLQRNDSLESRQSTLKRQNSLESHSSDSSSVVLRVSQNSSGKSSPQMSSTEMVQKLFGRPNSFNVEMTRRTPSPISSTTSTLSSPSPSPTVIDGPNNSVRIMTGGYKPPTQNSNIRTDGNKAIIIVNGGDTGRNANKVISKRNTFPANDNLILEESNNKPKRSSTVSAYVSAISQQQSKQEPTPPLAISKQPVLRKVSSSSESVAQNNARNVASSNNGPTSNGAPPPPPPPPVDGIAIKPQFSLDLKSIPKGGSNMRNSKSSTPSSPSSPDPRAEIFNAIKNSNGNFGLKKTGSSILLK